MVIDGQSVTIVIPCLNEELTIGKVIDDFRSKLPKADIIVIDNCSTDATAEVAQNHGARIIYEPRAGKGFAVERIFEAVESQFYVMVDGDDTYPADVVHKLLEPVIKGQADMVVGARMQKHTNEAFRPLHVLGNNLVRKLINLVSGAHLTDIMSGYRAFSNHVAHMLPVISAGFEIETDITLQMLYYRRKIKEVPIHYRHRPEGSDSKLRTFRDGFRVLWKIFTLFRSFKPLTFFGAFAIFLFLLGLWAGYYPLNDYLTDPNHFVRHVPLAILATGLMLLAAGSLFAGIILHAVNWRLLELHNVMSRRK